MLPSSGSIKPSILLIEPFYGGSHKQLIDLLVEELGDRVVLYSTPDKKWHWKARTSALYFAQIIPKSDSYQFMFASSVLNLAELVALRPDLARLEKILYFHENQLIYPAQEDKERDFQFGYNQILSAMVADLNIFNSKFNMSSFLDNIHKFLSKIPSPRPKSVMVEEIRKKCRVLYFPLSLPHYHAPIRLLTSFPDRMCSLCWNDNNCLSDAPRQNASNSQRPLHVVWPHRWEHDKDPDFFVTVLEQLHAEGMPFQVSVIGQMYSEVPASLIHANRAFANQIRYWGYVKSKEAYFDVLREADVVISTARHEFFGAAMLEAVYFGCYPLAPSRLVYPEIFPSKFLYDPSKPSNLTKMLRRFCCDPSIIRKQREHLDVGHLLWSTAKEAFLRLFV